MNMGTIKKSIRTVPFLFLAALCAAYGPGNATGGLPGWFLLRLSADAEQASMASAGASLDGNFTGIYFNPASLCRIRRDGFSAFYRPLFGGGNYYFAEAAHKFGPVLPLPGESFFALALAGIESGSAEKTTLLRESAGSFRDKQNAVILTAAYPAGSFFDFGANIKFVTQSIDGYQGADAGADIGLISRLKYLNISVCAQNIVKPAIKTKDFKDVYPLNLIFGLSSSFYEGTLIPAADFVIEDAPQEKNILWKAGVSYEATPLLSVRAGINYRELTAGFGIKTDPFSLDYALILHTLGLEHLISVKVPFSTRSGEEAQLYYDSRRKLDKEISDIRDVKKSYDNLIDSAIEYFLNGQYEVARDEFRKAVKMNPEIKQDRDDILDVELQIDGKIQKAQVGKLFAAAREYFKKADYKNCVKITDEILNFDPVNKYAMSLQNQCFAYEAINAGDYEKAEERLAEVLKLEPENAIVARLLKRLRTFMEYNKKE